MGGKCDWLNIRNEEERSRTSERDGKRGGPLALSGRRLEGGMSARLACGAKTNALVGLARDGEVNRANMAFFRTARGKYMIKICRFDFESPQISE